MSQSDIQPQPVGGNQEILQAIQALTNSIDSKVQSACKKQKLTDTPTFKRDGNQQQFSHCEKVLTLIETSLQNIETLDLDEAKSNLKEAIKATKERQKLIRLADRSELGWGVVKEYVADTLAEDSSDEKRIKKAEKAAAAKKPAPKKRASSSSRPYQTKTMAANMRTATPFRQQYFRPYQGAYHDNRICFQCGIQGHVRTTCPSLRALHQPRLQGSRTSDKQ
ncbi:uncharacterized protein LOC119740116 [Patiria miniata]|uniref:CCHC-type domain-containing protein n=1 Tax=Patiria miniata TaxID=46514 RepID=A0A914B606_PATMI|nr:uncharacterized protein LOC119740116 [Patiria miniata]